MQNLREHIEAAPDRSRAEWADAFGISRPHLYALLDGTRMPSFTVARKIERATNGKVPIGAWPNLKAIADAVHSGSSATATPEGAAQ